MQLSDAIRDAGLSRHAELIQRLAKPSIRLIASRVAEGESLPVGASRIGGTPDLPEGMNWAHKTDAQTRDEGWGAESTWDIPIFLPFLAQVNFAEFAALNIPDSPLPEEGTLLAFADAEFGHWQVRYIRDSTKLRPTRFPEKLSYAKRYPLYGVVPKMEWHLEYFQYVDDEVPTFDAESMLIYKKAIKVERDSFDAKPGHPFDRLHSALRFADGSKPGMENFHRLLGLEEPIQSSMSELELSARSAGKPRVDLYDIPTDDPIVERAIEEAIAAQWTLLLQIDSIREEPTMVWGDTGTHYWWIKRDDMLRCDFSNVQYDFQCG